MGDTKSLSPPTSVSEVSADTEPRPEAEPTKMDVDEETKNDVDEETKNGEVEERLEVKEKLVSTYDLWLIWLFASNPRLFNRFLRWVTVSM